jgi:HPt (histidine-containing phosphotransfer) domain-containing protein
MVRWPPQAAGPRLEAAPPADGDLLGSLAGIEGFAPAAGFDLIGDADSFEHLLRRFIANHEDGMPGLDNCLATGQRERARRMVHSLKGSTAAIGANMLAQLAAACEAAIARGEPTERLRLLAFDLEYELVHFIGTLHDRLPALAALEEDPAACEMSPAQLDAAVESLGFLLEMGDFGAERLHREIAADLRRTFGETAGLLAQAVRNHDHERALVLIETMKAQPRTATAAKEI